jgi:hypothetical protein
MRSVVLLILLFKVSVFAISEGEFTASRSINKQLVQKMMRKYSEMFVDNIEKYNASAHNVAYVLESVQDESRRASIKRYIRINKIKHFPKIVHRDGVAALRVGKHRIRFTVGTLFERYVLLDGKKLFLNSLNIDKQIILIKKVLKENPKRFSNLWSLLIESAYAKSADKDFEALVIGTIIVLNEKFIENSWCYFCEDEYQEATRKNFTSVMNEMEERAKKCESGESQELFAYQLEDLNEYEASATDLREKLNTYFKSYTNTSMNCSTMVNEIYKDEMRSLRKTVNMYTQSGNEKRHTEYIKSKCAAYDRFKKCLLEKTENAKDIYNNLRSKSKDQELPEERTRKFRSSTK